MNKISSYEAAVIQILQAAAIPFIREKQFKDLRHGFYRYDFYIPSMNILIEVDGEQHFIYNKRFFKNKADFTKAQERDRRKNSYALAHGISLYRLPFWDIPEILNFKQIIQKKYQVFDKYHNDNIWREYQKNIT